MPTKVRRERELKRAEERAKMKALSEKIPVYIFQRMLSGRKSKISPCDNIPEICNLKGGLVSGDENGNLQISPSTNLGNLNRQKYKEEDALELKAKYSLKWGVRGAARKIAEKESISLRTVQKYFKSFP